MKAKKFCIIALVLAIVLLIAPISESWAEEEPEVKISGDYDYIVLDDGTACIKQYNGKDKKVIIPDKLDEKRVTGICDSAFYECKNLTEIKIPDSVQSIGDIAFLGCENLTEINIPDSVEKIGVNPFDECINLLNIEISDNHPILAFIDNALFYKPEKKIVSYLSTSKKNKYEIPEGIESIGDLAFSWCTNLTEIKIPDSVQSIGNSAFLGCTNLTEIEIPDSVQSIGYCGFLWCENMKKITIPDGLQSIGDHAFDGCSNLTEITIPDNVKSLGDSAFYKCKNLTKIKISSSVNFIGKDAFKDCDNITVTVEKGSFAEKYCQENNINYMYEDSLDWLKD